MADLMPWENDPIAEENTSPWDNDPVAPDSNVVVHRESTGTNVSVPPWMNDPTEIEYMDDVQNRGQDPEGFFGGVNLLSELTEAVTSPFKGGAATAQTAADEVVGSAYLRKWDYQEHVYEKHKLSAYDYFHTPVDVLIPRMWHQATKSPEEYREVVAQKREEAIMGREQAFESIELNRYAVQQAWGLDPEAGPVDKLLYDFGSVTTSIFASVGLMYATRSPVASAALFTNLQKNSTYIEAREKGIDFQQADALSDIAGAAEGGLEFIGLSVFKRLGASDKVLTRISGRMVEEALQEGSQFLAEETIMQLGGVREHGSGSLKELAYTMFLGALGGGTTASVMELGRQAAREKNIPEEFVEVLAPAVQKHKGDAAKRVKQLIENEGKPTFQDKKLNKKVEKIILKFINGDEINMQEELEDIKGINQQQVQEIMDARDAWMAKKVETTNTQNRKVITARIKQLTNENDVVDRDISLLSDSINDMVEAGTVEGKKWDKLNKQLEEKIALRNSKDAEIEGYKQAMPPSDAAKKKIIEGEEDDGKLKTPDPVEIDGKTYYVSYDQDGSIKNVLTPVKRYDNRRAIEIETLRNLKDGKLKDRILEAHAGNQDKVKIPEKTAEVGEKEYVSIKAAAVAVNEAFKDTANSIMQKGIRTGKQLFRKDVNAAQKFIKDLIKTSPMEAKDKARLLAALPKVDTLEKAEKYLPVLQAKINQAQRKSQETGIRNALIKVLKASRSTKDNGKNKGRFADPDLQMFINRLAGISGLTQKKAAEMYAHNQKILRESPIDIDHKKWDLPENLTREHLVIEQNALAILSKDQNASIQDMGETLLGIYELIAAGKENLASELTSRRNRRKTLAMSLHNAIKSTKLKPNYNKTMWKNNARKWLNEASMFESWVSDGFRDFTDKIFGTTAEGRAIAKEMSDAITDSMQVKKQLEMNYFSKVQAKALEIYGLENNKQLRKKFAKDDKRITLMKGVALEGQNPAKRGNDQLVDEHELGDPEVIDWVLSISEARKLWMELQDPDLRETLTMRQWSDGERTYGNGITEQMEEVLEEFLNKTGTPEEGKEFQFALAQMDIYKEIFPDVNKIYGRIYGAYLDDNPHYSPVMRYADGDSNDVADDTFFNDMHDMAATPGFTKARRANHLQIQTQSDLLAMTRHIAQASHFVATAETVRDMNAVMKTSNLKRDMKNVYGDLSYEILRGYMEDFSVGHIKRTSIGLRWMDKLNKNMAISVLAGKPNLMFKQLTSFVAYASDIPAGEFNKGFLDFIVKQATAPEGERPSDILGSTPLMMARGSSEDVQIFKNASPEITSLAKKKATIDEMLMLPIRLGDRGAIYMGGWAVYRYHKEVLGKTHEQALVEFQRTTSLTQQSSDLDQLSRLQAINNPFARTITMFMTAPNAYYRASKRAIRHYSRGQIGKAELLKKLSIYNIMIPVLFGYVSNGFTWEDDDDEGFLDWMPSWMEYQLIMAPIQGNFVVANMASEAVAKSQDKYYPEKGINMFQGLKGVGMSIFEGDLEGLVEALGLVVGINAAQGLNIAGGAEDIADGDTLEGLKRISGYSENIAKQ